MAIKTFQINSILGGQSAAYKAYGDGQFLTSLGIDPERQLNSAILRSSSMIVPTRYEKFSGATMDSAPYWILTSPKSTTIYIYAQNGDIFSYTSALASETLVGTVTGGNGSGAAYYNNYHYFAADDNVARYGPLDGSPSLTQDVWTGATLGSQPALDTTVDHPMHFHEDTLYFGDYVNGYGVINAITTTKVSAEGDTNNGSNDAVLNLPFGFKVVDIESFGTDLAILAYQGSASVTRGNAALFLWDTNSTSWYRRVNLPYDNATALINRNGSLILFGTTGVTLQISEYVGGYGVNHIASLLDLTSPQPGAIDINGNRIAWLSRTTYPTTAVGVFTLGYENPRLPGYAINCIGRATVSGSTPSGHSLKFLRANEYVGQPIVGWSDSDGNEGLDKRSSTATFNSVFRSQVFPVGQRFTIKRVRIPMGVVVDTNMSVTPKIYVDNEVSNVTLTEINSTKYPGSARLVDDFTPVHGHNNFFLELNFAGSALLPIDLPITITVETQND